MANEEPTREDFIKALDYNPDTGVFTWKPRTADDGPHYKTFNTVWAGKVAGFPRSENDYLIIGFRRRSFYAHRIAWLITYGEWPSLVDHANGIRDDNRISNLRLASFEQNCWNTPKNRNNTSGYKGVTKTGSGKWQAKVCYRGKTYCFGSYETPEQAHKVREREAKRLHGEFARSS